jgi:hypothetical protein
MKTFSYFILISLLLSLGCGNEQKWAGRNPDRRAEFEKEQRQKLEDQFDEALRGLDREIDALNAKIEGLSAGGSRYNSRSSGRIESEA